MNAVILNVFIFLSSFVFFQKVLFFGVILPLTYNNQTTVKSAFNEQPGLPVFPAQALSILDSNLRILDWTQGKLNTDSYPDILLVMEPKNLKNFEENIPDSVEDKRTLLVLLGNAEGSYVLFLENPRIVLGKGKGGVLGDPYAGIQIKGKDFFIYHHGGSSWRWDQTLVFRWSEEQKTFLLRKDETYSFNVSSPKNRKKVKTRGMGVVGQTFESFDIYVDR